MWDILKVHHPFDWTTCCAKLLNNLFLWQFIFAACLMIIWRTSLSGLRKVHNDKPCEKYSYTNTFCLQMTSVRMHSSDSTFSRCALRQAQILSLLVKVSGLRCWVLVTIITSWVCNLMCECTLLCMKFTTREEESINRRKFQRFHNLKDLSSLNHCIPKI